MLDFGPVRFYIPRHFGFCYGVENAIEISYRALEENPDKKVFLLSQMIHNQEVNEDLQSKGIEFIMDTQGKHFIPWEDVHKEDVVIIPAFGTTLEVKEKLEEIGIEIKQYDTTCPFVERVWKRSAKIGQEDFTVIIHGNYKHEETRATFSHSQQGAPSVVVRDLEESRILGDFILGKRKPDEFHRIFKDRHSEDFDVNKDLERVGVVNQTTMLASETQQIADYIREVIMEKYGEANYKDHFADTRDTLCYATNDNQDATHELLKQQADLAIVVGGYNSSNTSHIVELCEMKFPTYFINSEKEIISPKKINHFDIHTKQRKVSNDFLPDDKPSTIVLTSGASCPDTILDRVLMKILDFYGNSKPVEVLLEEFETVA